MTLIYVLYHKMGVAIVVMGITIVDKVICDAMDNRRFGPLGCQKHQSVITAERLLVDSYGGCLVGTSGAETLPPQKVHRQARESMVALMEYIRVTSNRLKVEVDGLESLRYVMGVLKEVTAEAIIRKIFPLP